MSQNTALQVIQPKVPVGTLDAYIQRINQIPLLTAEEEQELSERLHRYEDLQAAQRLVTAHLRYVVRVAKGYMGYGLPLADLIQEGTVGLMKAVKRFQPDKGVRLVSFAVHWIKAEMHEYILKNWRIVKVATTKAQRKLFFNLRGAKKRLGWFTKEEVEAVAQDLGVKPEEVLKMEERLSAKDQTFDLPPVQQNDNSQALPAPSEVLASKTPDPLTQLENLNWGKHVDEKLQIAFQKLDKRSQDIVQRRWLQEQKATLQELALEYKISPERIRQLEKAAIMKLREEIVETES